MACTPIYSRKDRMSGWACTRGRRKARLCGCGNTETRLCDFILPSGTTCDTVLCNKCATSVGKDRDLCRAHADGGFKSTVAAAVRGDAP